MIRTPFSFDLLRCNVAEESEGVIRSSQPFDHFGHFTLRLRSLPCHYLVIRRFTLRLRFITV